MNLDKTISDLIARVPEPVADTYLDEEGFKMCAKCHTRREALFEFQEKKKKVPCICKCQAEALNTEEENRKKEEKMRRVEQLRRTGFSDKSLAKCTFENDDQTHANITKAAKNYVENFSELKSKGKGLLFYGGAGTGKTFIAACIANALIDKGIPVMVTNFTRISNKLQESFEGRQAYLDSLCLFDLLIIDDLAAERKTEFMQETVYNVIDARYRSGLPMIITTNLTLDEIKNPADESDVRIYDRLLEKCFPIEFKGSSHRRKNIRDEYGDMKNLLGLN